MFMLQQVFWLSDQPEDCGLPIRVFPDSGSSGLQSPFPITAAGPPRNYTVFRNAEATMIKENFSLCYRTVTSFLSTGFIQENTRDVNRAFMLILQTDSKLIKSSKVIFSLTTISGMIPVFG
jgi:hypothetical protein